MRLKILLSGLLFNVILATAANVIHTFHFDFNDFKISLSGDSIEIASTKSVAVYPNFDEPGLPIVARSIGNVDFETVKDFTYTISKRLVCKDVDIRKSPIPLPTNVSVENAVTEGGQYPKRIYPDSNCILQKSYNIGGVEITNFLISPFVYDASVRELYFVDSLVVDMDMESIDFSTVNLDRPIRQNQIDMISALIENPEIIENLPMSYDLGTTYDWYEYLIITTEEFKDAFIPLAKWKYKKGVRSKIITVEEIYTNYEGGTQQIKIKNCIKDYYDNHYTQYVLLGGDVDFVPTQKCFLNTGIQIPNTHGVQYTYKDTIPSDIFYSCLTNIDWDLDGDGVSGDNYGDNKIDLMPYVDIARLPLRTSQEVADAVERIIAYEQSPTFTYAWLQVGSVLNSTNGFNGEGLADLLYGDIISGKIRMERFKFFDTFVYSGEEFCAPNLIKEINKGYQFVQVYSHGNENNWTNDSNSFFSREDATMVQNTGHTFVTTTACYTNAFDKNENTYKSNPCLGEAFWRNPYSGVVGYLGSSRYGWYYDGTYTLELSYAYEQDFYERLMNTDTRAPYKKNFGTLVNYVKRSMLNQSYSKILYRWLHYSINVIGDPETPIFNTYPSEFSLAKSSCNNHGVLTVNTGVEDSRVCISKKGEYPSTVYEVKDGSTVEFALEDGVYDIWITKQNYKPKCLTQMVRAVADINDEENQYGINLIQKIPQSSILVYYTPFKNSETIIMLHNVNTGVSYSYSADSELYKKSIEISNLPSGVYVVTMYSDGHPCPNYKQFIND